MDIHSYLSLGQPLAFTRRPGNKKQIRRVKFSGELNGRM